MREVVGQKGELRRSSVSKDPIGGIQVGGCARAALECSGGSGPPRRGRAGVQPVAAEQRLEAGAGDRLPLRQRAVIGRGPQDLCHESEAHEVRAPATRHQVHHDTCGLRDAGPPTPDEPPSTLGLKRPERLLHLRLSRPPGRPPTLPGAGESPGAAPPRPATPCRHPAPRRAAAVRATRPSAPGR